jgi:hypothetical protein
MTEEKAGYIVYTVPTLDARDKLVKELYQGLTMEPRLDISVIQDQINRIKIFHNVRPGMKILIRTYLVIVVPIHIDTKALYDLRGSITFHLDETIDVLKKEILKLQSLQGHKIMKGNSKYEQTLEQLVTSLSGASI